MSLLPASGPPRSWCRLIRNLTSLVTLDRSVLSAHSRRGRSDRTSGRAGRPAIVTTSGTMTGRPWRYPRCLFFFRPLYSARGGILGCAAATGDTAGRGPPGALRDATRPGLATLVAQLAIGLTEPWPRRHSSPPEGAGARLESRLADSESVRAAAASRSHVTCALCGAVGDYARRITPRPVAGFRSGVVQPGRTCRPERAVSSPSRVLARRPSHERRIHESRCEAHDGTYHFRSTPTKESATLERPSPRHASTIATREFATELHSARSAERI
jgi:hypothetical protein